MKKLLLILMASLFIKCQVSCQQVRQIQLSELAQVWGLLKYYHPEVASGKFNWDSVLISSLKQLGSVKNNGRFTAVIDGMLLLAGLDTAAFYISDPDDEIATRNVDKHWISKSKYLNKQQRKQLDFIMAHPQRGGNVYALTEAGIDSTVKTPNEKAYKDQLMPGLEYRLLGLFRFWNVINYYYPYKYLVGRPWNEVLLELIPVIIEADDTTSYHRAIARMAASINDSHGGLWPEVYKTIAGKYSPPFYFRLAGDKAVVTKVIDSSLASHPSLHVGSVLTSINGVLIKDLIKQYWDYVPASNNGGKLKTMHGFMLNSFASEARYGMLADDGRFLEITLAQRERNFLSTYLDFFQMESRDTSGILQGNIGYVYFSNLNSRNLHPVMKSLMDTRAIIFDMRNYPTDGAGIYWVPEYLLRKPVVYARNTHPDFSYPGRFSLVNSNEGTAYGRVGKQNSNQYKGKIILLVDDRTQSAGEWACMALMTAQNVTVIGNQTAGADGNVTSTLLPGGYRISFSGLGIYFPDGRETQRKGIPIDVAVEYTLADRISGRDPILEKAIELAKQ